jgi:hypothetical protein
VGFIFDPDKGFCFIGVFIYFIPAAETTEDEEKILFKSRKAFSIVISVNSAVSVARK